MPLSHAIASPTFRGIVKTHQRGYQFQHVGAREGMSDAINQGL
jgi:hypothetical protein